MRWQTSTAILPYLGPVCFASMCNRKQRKGVGWNKSFDPLNQGVRWRLLAIAEYAVSSFHGRCCSMSCTTCRRPHFHARALVHQGIPSLVLLPLCFEMTLRAHETKSREKVACQPPGDRGWQVSRELHCPSSVYMLRIRMELCDPFFFLVVEV